MARTATNPRAGYTLIELALVIAVLGIMLGFGLTLYTKRTEATKLRITQERLDRIETALADFVLEHRHLPCPALGSAAEGSPQFGNSASVTYVAGECAGILTGNTGTIPTRTLNLEDDHMTDGWGRRFSYRIAHGLGLAAEFSSKENRGDLSVTDLVGNQLTGINLSPPDNYGAAYVVISHGANGRGAWTKSGSLVSPIPTGPELQNYNHAANKIYIQSDRADYFDTTLSINVYFDDIVRFKSKIPLSRGQKKLVSPIRIPSRVCQDARAIVDGAKADATPIGNFDARINTSSGGAVTNAGQMVMLAADTLDTLCTSVTPLTDRCAGELVWELRGALTDCYCPNAGQYYYTTFSRVNPVTGTNDLDMMGGCR